MDGKFICPIQNGWEVYLSLPKWKGCALLPFCRALPFYFCKASLPKWMGSLFVPSKMDGKCICPFQNGRDVLCCHSAEHFPFIFARLPFQNGWEVYLSHPKWMGSVFVPSKMEGMCSVAILQQFSYSHCPNGMAMEEAIQDKNPSFLPSIWKYTKRFTLVKKFLVACIVTRLLRSITTFNFYVAGNFFIF